MDVHYRVQTDVLVVGQGGAGIKAAIKAAEEGVDVLMVGPHAFGRTGATFYPGTPGWGMQAIVQPGDQVDYFYQEILEAGAGMADPACARVLAQNCTQAFRDLEAYGVRFEQDADGRYLSVIPCFGKRLRGGSARGMDQIRRALWLRLKQVGVRLQSGVLVVALLQQGGQVCGALALDEQDELFVIESGAVVLATGGACSLYRYALATAETTGIGQMLALEAGASLINLEFIQFIPGLVWPVAKLLFQEKNLDTLPTMTNGLGQAVLQAYLPPNLSARDCLVQRAKHGPFTTADSGFYFDIALYEEIRKGQACPGGGIRLQYDPAVLTDPRWEISSWLTWMKERGVDPVDQGFELVPHAQCFNGGVRIDPQASCGVPGLYAAGEVSGGPHGADRLGGAAIAATQVFGALAGSNSARFSRTASRPRVADSQVRQLLDTRLSRWTGNRPDGPSVRDRVSDLLWQHAAIVRSQSRSQAGLDQLQVLGCPLDPDAFRKQPAGRKAAIHDELALGLSDLLLQAILERDGSCGPHYRQDDPKTGDQSQGPLLATQAGEGVTWTRINWA